MTTTAQRLNALETKTADHERRIGLLEKAAAAPAPAAPPVQAPGPEPTPAPVGVLWPPTDTLSQLASLTKDPTVPEIWLDGTYRVPELYFGGDRKGQTLRIGSAPGKTHRFVGPGRTLAGQIFIGDPEHGDAPCVGGWWFDGITAGGGIKLAKAGLIELRRGTGVRISRPYADGDIRDATYVTKDGLHPLPYHTWLIYGSSKAGGGLHDILIEDAHGVGVNRSWSLIQFDSGEEPMSNVVVRNATAEHCAYLLYGNIPTAPGATVTLDGLTAIDTAQGGSSVHWLKGSGTYRGFSRDSLSGAFVNDIPTLMKAIA